MSKRFFKILDNNDAMRPSYQQNSILTGKQKEFCTSKFETQENGQYWILRSVT